LKAFITIELEIPFSEEDTKELDEILKKQSKTFKYHISENMEKILVDEADIQKEYIKSIEINRVD
jgi:gas vesicle protein